MRYSSAALRQIIRCSLNLIDLWSPSAEELLLGTAAKESHLGGLGLVQIGGGPARGIYQVEPATELDVWENYLQYRMELLRKVVGASGLVGPDPDSLKHDPVYGTIIARLVYYRAPEALPPAGDVPALAEYWKNYYNTVQGKGKLQGFIDIYRLLIRQEE